MEIAILGYKFNNARIFVGYDTLEKRYYIHEILKIEGCKRGFIYKVKTKNEALDILNNFKKAHMFKR